MAAIINGKSVRFVAEVPELMEQWDWERNPGVDPAKVPIRSTIKRWFRCHKCNHSQWSSPNNKTLHSKVGGCRACLDQVVNNFDRRNSFGKVYPDLVKFWDYERNKDTPYDVTHGSGSRRWFKCKTCGRTHLMPVYLFPVLEGCSKCIKQIHTSFGEYAVAYYLKKCGLEVVQGDREILDGLELDIYVPSMKLAIEYDGSYYHKHEASSRKQSIKYEKCMELGITLIRVCECQTEAEAASMDASGVCDWFTSFRSTPSKKNHEMAIVRVLDHLGLSCNVNLVRDSNEIDLPRKMRRVEHSVAKDEYLSGLWLNDKNEVNPESVSAKSSLMKYWFKCPRCGRDWYTDPANVKRGGGCLFCYPKSQPRKIVEKDVTGAVVVRIWDSAYVVEREYGICYGTVKRAARGVLKREGCHVTHGKWFEYLKDDAK